MADLRRRKVGQIWECRNYNFYNCRFGNHFQIIGFENSSGEPNKDVIHLYDMNRNRHVYISRRGLTTQNNQWIYIGEGSAHSERTHVMRCSAGCGRVMLVKAVFPTPQTCDLCRDLSERPPR